MKEKNTHDIAEAFGESKLFYAYLLKVGKIINFTSKREETHKK
jgi:hypothetical protein